MLGIIITILVVLLVLGLLFSPEVGGYEQARHPLVAVIVILLVLFLLFHPF
jgi:hypothetical protein